MRKFLLLVLMIAIIPCAYGRRSGGAQGMNVELREVLVKSSPSYLSKTVGRLVYGDKVAVVGDSQAWYQISSPSGWIPKNSLTKRKVKVNPDQKYSGRGVSHDEVALAGKGFNPQVEAQYLKDNADMKAAYEVVNEIERFVATEAELVAFCKAGKLL